MPTTLVTVKRVPPDGSCLYHAVIACLAKRRRDGGHSVRSLRGRVAQLYEHIAQGDSGRLSTEYLSPLQYYASAEGLTVKQYISKTRKTMWGGPLEIEMLSRLLRCRIAVLNMDDLVATRANRSVYSTCQATPILDFGSKRRTPLLIGIHGYQPVSGRYGAHYDALVRVKFVR